MAVGVLEDGQIICGNGDCRIVETGRCVEGLTRETCPNFGRMPDEVATQEETDDPESADLVHLAHATTMRPEETSSVLRAGDARVVAIIGSSDAGKTSLIAGLYDLFQEGPVADVEFARSTTLHAFEQACHDARAASRRDVPRMERTPRGEVRFYHLEVGGGAAGRRVALTLGDRAGEEYREASDDPSSTPPFAEIRRADVVTVLVDGERLLDGGARHNLRSEVTMILQSLRDGAAKPERARLALVLTKLDSVVASPRRVRAEQDFERLSASIREVFGDLFTDIEAFSVAASPTTDVLPRGTGVAPLLLFWLRQSDVQTVPSEPTPEFERTFSRLQPLEE